MKQTPPDPMDDEPAPEDFQDESSDDVVVDALDGADGGGAVFTIELPSL